jgi:hypothetical protein
MAKKAQVHASGDVGSLVEFWQTLMKGRFAAADENGIVKEMYVPLDMRLKASELLAKYILPRTAPSEDDSDITTTPEILKVADLLTNSDQYTDAEIKEAIEISEKNNAKRRV